MGRGFGRGMGMMRQFTETFRPEFQRRDVPLFEEQLELDKGQMEVVESLMADYEAGFTPAAQAAQEKMQDLGRQMVQTFFDDGMRQRMESSMEAMRADLEQLAVESGGQIDPEKPPPDRPGADGQGAGGAPEGARSPAPRRGPRP